MNDYSKKINPFGSPLFNNFAELQLELFDEISVKELIRSTLQGTSVTFDDSDREYVINVSGCHPYRLQAGCAALYDAIVSGKRGEEKYLYASEKLVDILADHFSRVWEHLDDKSRTVLVIMVVLYYKGIVLGKDYSFGEIEKSNLFAVELKNLRNLGLVTKIDNHIGAKQDLDSYLIWRGQKWQISCESAAWWISKIIIGGFRDIPDFYEWLKNQEVTGYILDSETMGELCRLGCLKLLRP